jgi:hypothetical protein
MFQLFTEHDGGDVSVPDFFKRPAHDEFILLMLLNQMNQFRGNAVDGIVDENGNKPNRKRLVIFDARRMTGEKLGGVTRVERVRCGRMTREKWDAARALNEFEDGSGFERIGGANRLDGTLFGWEGRFSAWESVEKTSDLQKSV